MKIVLTSKELSSIRHIISIFPIEVNLEKKNLSSAIKVSECVDTTIDIDEAFTTEVIDALRNHVYVVVGAVSSFMGSLLALDKNLGDIAKKFSNDAKAA